MTKKLHLNGISGLRAVSILMVLMSHWGYFLPEGIGFTIRNGALGVHIFFVISGFLITTLMLREESLNGAISLKNFYIRRSLRIFPAFYFLLLFYFILQQFGKIQISTMSWFSSVAYLKYFPIPDSRDNFTFHFWSLSIEEHFYLIWPLVFSFASTYRTRVLWALAIVIPLLRMVFYQNNMFWEYGEYSIFYRGDGIVWGCLFAIYQKPLINWLQKQKIRLYVPFILLVILLYLERLNIKAGRNLHLGYFNVPLGGSMGSLTSCCIGMIILITSQMQSIWSRLMNLAPFEYIGKLSYSLYLYQQIFLLYFLKDSDMKIWAIPAMIGMSLLSYYLVEKPFLRLKDKFAQ